MPPAPAGEGTRLSVLANLNDYYDVSLKEARLARLEGKPGFRFVRGDVADTQAVLDLLPASASTASSIWPPRPASAIR